MDLGEIDVLHVVCGVIVANLSSSPIDTLDLHNLAIFDLAGERDCWISQLLPTGELEAELYRPGAICSVYD